MKKNDDDIALIKRNIDLCESRIKIKGKESSDVLVWLKECWEAELSELEEGSRLKNSSMINKFLP